MAYVEFLRVRLALLIYTGVVAVVVVLLVLGAGSAAVHSGPSVSVVVGTDSGHSHAAQTVSSIFAKTRIPLGLLLGIAGYCAVVFATILASSINKENEHAHLSYTKPISRTRLGLGYFAVDVCGIALAYLIAFVLIGLLPLLSVGLLSRVYFDVQSVWIGALGLGIAFMWYGILQAATSWYGGRGGVVTGLSWAFFAILVGLSDARFLGPVLLGVVHALNLVNPLAYFTTLTQQPTGDALAQSTLGFGLQQRVVMAWCIAMAAGAIALAAQKRVEV